MDAIAHTAFVDADEQFFTPGATNCESLGKLSVEERQSPRHNVPQSRRACELLVGPDVVSGLLINESKDGFAAWVDRPDWLKVGSKVELRTTMGWYLTHVAYLNKATRPKDIAGEGNWFRVGLKIRKRLPRTTTPNWSLHGK